MVVTDEIDGFMLFAENTLKKAGDVLLSFRDRNRIKKIKDSLHLDIATEADYATEKCIIKEIRSRFPDHSILTEETSGLESDSEYCWIIDPLDGTKEYVRHSPYFYTLLALKYREEIIVGAGYQPVVGRIFVSGKGKGLTVDGHGVYPSSEASLEKSFVSIALPQRHMPPHLLNPYLSVLGSLSVHAYRLRNTAWDVEALFNVASGLVEAYLLPPHEKGHGPKPWDIASGIAAVMATGGKLTDFQGHPFHSECIEKGLVASNEKVHEKLLAVIQTSYQEQPPPA